MDGVAIPTRKEARDREFYTLLTCTDIAELVVSLVAPLLLPRLVRPMLLVPMVVAALYVLTRPIDRNC